MASIVFEVATLIISLVAVSLAFWQGNIAKRQLEESKETKTETEKLLDEIKEKVVKIESISDETRKEVKDQVSKLIDKQDENFKTLLNAPREDSQNQMIAQLLPVMMNNPDTLKALIDLGSQKK
jgi:gas vesicle protein